MFRLRFDEGGLANGVRPCGPSPHHPSTSHKLVISSRCRNGGRSWTRCLCRYYSDDAGCSAEANLDTDDWARRMEHCTAGIAAVKRRAEDSGLSRFERWAGSTGCALRAGYMNPTRARPPREMNDEFFDRDNGPLGCFDKVCLRRQVASTQRPCTHGHRPLEELCDSVNRPSGLFRAAFVRWHPPLRLEVAGRPGPAG